MTDEKRLRFLAGCGVEPDPIVDSFRGANGFVGDYWFCLCNAVEESRGHTNWELDEATEDEQLDAFRQLVDIAIAHSERTGRKPQEYW